MPNGLQRTVPHGYTVPHQNQNQNHLICNYAAARPRRGFDQDGSNHWQG